MALRVQDRSAEATWMEGHWTVTQALSGGTATMRNEGKTYLPKWPAEDEDSYQARLAVSTLFPAFDRTVGVMSGKPFSKQLTLGDDVPSKLQEWCENIDREGRSLHAVASELCDESLRHGFCGVMVEYPQTVTKEGALAIKTKYEEEKAGIRPYVVKIKHDQYLGCKVIKANDGTVVLTQLRISEVGETDDGEFGVACVKRVRVWEPNRWVLYEEVKEKPDTYAPIEEGPNTLGKIPFVPFYGRRVSFMIGVPPLMELAYLNIKHWQSQSDQDNILHVARVPILVQIGVDENTPKFTIGSNMAGRLPKDADMKFVEHEGHAIDAGKESLSELKEEMVQTGAELLIPKPGQRSATEANNDAEGNKSDLQRIVEMQEDSLDQVLQLMADWAKLGTGGHVSLFKDFAVATLSEASAQLVLSMQQAGVLTKKTLIQEQQRRGILSPDIDPDDELEAAAEEAPSLGEPGSDEGDPPESKDPETKDPDITIKVTQ